MNYGTQRSQSEGWEIEVSRENESDACQPCKSEGGEGREEVKRRKTKGRGQLAHSAPEVTGKRFGRLTAIGEERGRNGKLRVICKCDCGKTKSIDSYSLRVGDSESCGCRRIERTSRAKTTHGKSNSRTYAIWLGMNNRCKNPNVKAFPSYGGRGISICERWKRFESFLADMGEVPTRMSIERIDVNGNYEPGNCRWATMEEQATNKRNTLRTTYLGITKTNAEWEEILGFPPRLIAKRIRHGWSLERTMNQPVRKSINDH